MTSLSTDQALQVLDEVAREHEGARPNSLGGVLYARITEARATLAARIAELERLAEAYRLSRNAYEHDASALLKIVQALDNGECPQVRGFDPSGDERTATLRWPSGNLHSYDRTDMRTVDLQDEQIRELQAALTAAESRARGDAEDAARYRWLRDNPTVVMERAGGFFRVSGMIGWHETPCAAIDAALAERQDKGEGK